VSSFDEIVDFLRFISKSSVAMHQHQNASDVGMEKVTRLLRKQRASSLHRQNNSILGHLPQVVAVFLQIFHSITRRHGIATRCFFSPPTRLFADETRRVFVPNCRVQIQDSARWGSLRYQPSLPPLHASFASRNASLDRRRWCTHSTNPSCTAPQ